MKTIWKYPMAPQLWETIVSHEIPSASKILCIQMQNGEPMMWVEVESDSHHTVRRTFEMFGTGHELPQDVKLDYIGTFQVEQLVFHYYEHV